jgi:hypothetical protein
VGIDIDEAIDLLSFKFETDSILHDLSKSLLESHKELGRTRDRIASAATALLKADPRKGRVLIEESARTRRDGACVSLEAILTLKRLSRLYARLRRKGIPVYREKRQIRLLLDREEWNALNDKESDEKLREVVGL